MSNLFARVEVHPQQQGPYLPGLLSIEFQLCRSRAPFRAEPDDIQQVLRPLKMLVPRMEARVEQARRRGGLWVDRLDGPALGRITAWARPCKVLTRRISARRLGKTMVAVERRIACHIRIPAVFAAAAGAIPHGFP